MKKFRNILICLFAFVGALCIYVGCGSNEPAVSGIENGQTYILEDGDIAAEFETGSATLAKDGGAAADYASGTLITEAGQYVFVWTDGDRTETYNFTVKHDESATPVVSGVTDGQTVEFGTAVTPTFDKGTATLAKDSATAVAFTSGTQVTEIGSYVLTVTNQGVSVTVRFEIVIPSYSGQMTDEFLSPAPMGYTNTEDSILTLEDGALRITDVDDNNGYCLARKQFTGVDLETYPCVEFEVLEMDYVSVKFSVGVQNIIDQGANTATYAYSAGKVYIDLKSFAEANGLNISSCDLWLQISLEGDGANAGSLTALIEGYRSVKEIPAEVPVSAYIDNTAETLNQWVTNTARLQYFEGVGAVGTVTNSNPNEEYGKFVKRVQFNTKSYPYLIVDVASVVSGWKIEAFNYENNLWIGQQTTIRSQTNDTGKIEINLQNIFGVDECVDVRLDFYIVGKSTTDQFILNGLYTSANPLNPPVISGIADGDIYNLSVHGALAPTFDKGTATLSKDGGAAQPFAMGDTISEAGTYKLSVTIGESMTTEVSFNVIEEDYPTGTVEDFLTESRFTTTGGTFEVVDNDGAYTPTFTKAVDGTMGKVNTRIDFDFTTTGVIVFEIMPGSANFDLSAFGFELLDDINWYHVLGKGNPNIDGYADYVEEIKDTDDSTVIGYKLYFRITAAKRTDGSGATVSWVGQKKNNLQLSVSLETDGSMAVIIRSVSLVESYPGEGQGGSTAEPEDIIGTLLDSYDEYTGFNQTGTGGSAGYDAENDEIVLTTGDKDNITLNKTYTFNFAENGKYLVLVFETNGYNPDAGFSLSLRNEATGPWQNLQVRYPDFAHVEIESLSNGRMCYTCYIEVNGLTDMAEPNEFHDYTSQTAATLIVGITVEYGANKTVYLQLLSQTDSLPAESGSEA